MGQSKTSFDTIPFPTRFDQHQVESNGAPFSVAFDSAQKQVVKEFKRNTYLLGQSAGR